MSPALAWGLALFLSVLLVERVVNLSVSARNTRRLKAAGAREVGSGHFPLLILAHVLFPVSLVAEVHWLGARPGGLWPTWLVLLVAAQALRVWAIRTLGRVWSVRILVVDEVPLVRRGPYRWLRHPAYLAVALELLCAPLLFGAWRTALGISALNAVALGARIRAEDAALRARAIARSPDRHPVAGAKEGW